MNARICVVGDELAAGVGDARGLGWLGRVIARTEEPLAVFTLAVPDETTTALSARWETESNRRFRGEDDRLVVALSSHDLAAGVSLARSRLNLANVLDEATNRRIPSFVVGPPPRTDLPEEAQAELSGAFADVCGRRRIPYAETYAPLRYHEQWLADLGARDGILPGQAGYGLLAWLVLHNGWHSWLGLPGDA
ncbi:GDSL-type esterase/lipase family protein [Pseudactinotalea sp. HY158]|uniref:GDSL-type esterase/lipase family protein n=1 Tax=unclassified Pseudactinotalea TaxID=2649176 RepID=UPI00129CC46E|nr:GDSL-type esterase/lipase family protein [Pseudactinotalea sp. HY158]MPV48895.1 lysophospholipase [Pseudactinotalea sp. HY160]QGH68871.1 lysophospholipase [Pseudactinotalea sp. HY158]